MSGSPACGAVHRPILVLALLALLAGLVSGPAQAASPEPVKLGINYPLTGPYSVEGLDEIRAARLAVDELNAKGGILGRRVDMIAVDSASDVLETRINVHALIEAGCTMIFGGVSSAVAMTAADICQRAGVLFFGTLAYSTAFTLEGAHRFSFRECSDSWMAAMVLADWLNARFAGKRYFYITADYTWGWTTEESLRQVTGTGDASVHPGRRKPLGTTDFQDALAEAAAASPDVLVLALFGKDAAYALRQASDLGLHDRCQIVVPNLTLGIAERSGPKAMEGVVGTTPWSWQVPELCDSRQGKAFVAAFTARYRRYPSTAGASAYAIVNQYAEAVARAGSFDGPAVIRALEGSSYELLKGRQTWRALDHQNVQTVYLVRGKPAKAVLADPFRLDYFEIVASMPGEATVRPASDWMRLRREAGLPPFLEPLPGEAGHAP